MADVSDSDYDSGLERALSEMKADNPKVEVGQIWSSRLGTSWDGTLVRAVVVLGIYPYIVDGERVILVEDVPDLGAMIPSATYSTRGVIKLPERNLRMVFRPDPTLRDPRDGMIAT